VNVSWAAAGILRVGDTFDADFFAQQFDGLAASCDATSFPEAISEAPVVILAMVSSFMPS
jgi:hypothetical protein